MQFARAVLADGPATVGFITDLTEENGHRRACANANQRSAEMSGRERADDLVGRPVYELFAAQLQQESRDRSSRRSLGLDVPSKFQSVFLRADGSQMPVEVEVGTVQLCDGLANIAFISDMTERLLAEQSAKERTHFLEELLEAVPVPIHYKDSTLHFVGCNEAYAAFLGRPRNDIIGKTVFDVISPELAERFNDSDRELLAHPERQIENEVEFPGPDGTPMQVVCHKAVFSDVEGKPGGLVGVNLDVTEIRRPKGARRSAERIAFILDGAVAALGATTELRDPYTAGHQRRVAELAYGIALDLGWDEALVKSLRIGAVLHDVGKIVLPAEILAKPGN